jgi:sulfotransferase
VTSPMAGLCALLQQKMANSEFAVFFDEPRREQMLQGIFRSYYAHASAGQVVFDTNRSWTGRVPLLARLYPNSRVICCVRDVGRILDSIERLRAKNPLQLSKMFADKAETNVYARSEVLMDSTSGVIGAAWTTLREAWFSDEAKRLILVTHESLVRRPQQTLRRLYEELGEPLFEHDFEHVSYSEPDYDAQLGMPGLHTVRSVVRYEEIPLCIPPDLFNKYAKTNFWAQPDLNERAVLVL